MNPPATKIFYIPATRTKTVTNTQDVFMVNVWLLTRWIRRCKNWSIRCLYTRSSCPPMSWVTSRYSK